MIFSGKIFDRKRHLKSLFLSAGLLSVLSLIFTSSISAQSTDQNSPTPLVTNEIRGRINARDLGDSRLTTYYYTFTGERGDVFINVITANLNGDVDIFTANTLQPRTKITVYANSSAAETGRVVYMRQPEKLILRVQGRTPNDDPATFQIKFAGSFLPFNPADVAETEAPPKVEIDRKGTVRVNSVGTIIEDAKSEKDVESEIELNEDKVAEKDNADHREIPKTFDPTKKTDSVLPEVNSILNPTKVEETTDSDTAKDEMEVTVNIETEPKDSSTVVRIEKTDEDAEKAEADTEKTEAEKEAKRLAKISLKINLKNGEKFVRTMNEVLSINVIKTVLTIVTSDGKIHEFSIFEVGKMTID